MRDVGEAASAVLFPQQRPDVHVPDQAAVAVHQMGVVERLARVDVRDRLERLVNGLVLAHRHHVGGHDPAGRVVLVLHEFTDILGFFRTHELEDLRGSVVRKIGENVRGVVGGHVFDDSRDLGAGQGLEDFRSRDRGELGEDVRLDVGADERKQAFQVAAGSAVQDLGDIGGVQAADRRAYPIPLFPSYEIENAGFSFLAACHRCLRLTGSVWAARRRV